MKRRLRRRLMMAKHTETYVRKSDGMKVEVLMDPAGWAGWKKIYEPHGNVFRMENSQFFVDYEPHVSFLQRIFHRGVK